MKENIQQLLFDTIKKIIKLKESTGIVVDVSISFSFLIADFYFYSTNNDINYIHTECVYLDSGDAIERLDKIYELLDSLDYAIKETQPFNNQLN